MPDQQGARRPIKLAPARPKPIRPTTPLTKLAARLLAVGMAKTMTGLGWRR